MDFSFLRNWFDTTNTSVNDVNLKPNNVEQSSSPSTDSNEYSIDDVEEDDELKFLGGGYEFINPRDPNEVHSLPDQKGESVVEIAGFNKEKLLEMSNFCAISYGDSDEKLGKKYFRALADDDSLSSGNEEDFAILENEKMY
ncbi:MAG: lipase family protein, partial [Wolbachia endosymbiont of Alcedoecus sp.]|nr:lipase family protein [Wolbachia endosymbiont of Alcedoecus sp.]